MKRLIESLLGDEEEDHEVVLKHTKYNRNLTLVSLPTEILDIIFSYLSKQDIINLSTLDHNFRRNIIPIIFSQIKFTWKKVIESKKQNDGFFWKKYKYFIHQIRITDSNSLYEWNFDIFTELLMNLPHVNHLLINTRSSSNWLKYRQHDNLERLTLYCANRTNTMGLFTPINNKIFSLDHIGNFKMLRKLELNNYRFYTDHNHQTYPVLMIEDISLLNCSWDYPFQLSHLNYNENIKKLTIRNSGNDSFIVSERYRYFLDQEVLKSLEELEISITKGQLSSSLNSSMVGRLMNEEIFPNLIKLKFHGWHGTYNVSHWFNKLPQNDKLQLLELKLVSELDDIEKANNECRKYFPYLKLKLT